MTNLFEAKNVTTAIARINQLTPTTTPKWGKMTVDQMLAHCNVAYDMAYTDKYPKAGAFKKFMLKMFVKSAVVGPKPYPKNGRTAPEFVMTGEKNFQAEKQRMIDYLQKTQQLGTTHFEQKENINFGKLSSQEWNMMFAKHLDHHLTQFGV